ncbi:MAG: hypothetical protein JNJ42_06625 [Burkholderiaceae bacterium]|nr:hypothetical protein [Burkholderiaceae bacterium]
MTACRHPSAASRSSWSPRVAMIVAGLAASAALLPATSRAAVEFVTPVGTCDKVDTIGDGKDLRVQAGNNMRFEVWGDGIDVSPAVRVTVDDSNVDSLVTARIIRAHNGAENLMRGCRILKGSVEVEVDSPAEAGTTRQRSLRFRMPLGDESRLQMRAVPFSTPVWTFESSGLVQRPSQCLTKNIGTVVQDLNNTRMTITLPPGANSDTSNCELEFRTRVAGKLPREIDIWGEFGYTVTSPAHVRLVSGGNIRRVPPWQDMVMRFTGDVANIRGTRATRTSTLTVATPNPNRSDTLTLVINPPPAANAFTQACVCRNQTTGDTVNANDNFQCELRLSQQPPAGGQRIEFEVQDRLCVASGSPSVIYSSASGLGNFTAPATGTFHQIPFRAVGGNTSAGTACASRTSPVAHTLKFWVGARGAESGPAFTQCQIRIRIP